MRKIFKDIFVSSFIFIFAFFIFSNTSFANTLNVGSNQNYLTISSAVDAAVSGDTINISSGTYNESVLINKSLNLVGVGTKPVLVGGGNNFILKVENTNGVTIDNLEINGGSNNNLDYGVLVNSAGVFSDAISLKNSNIKNIWNIGASAVGVEGNSYVLINNNNVSLFKKNGLRFNASKGKVDGNTITGDTVDGIGRVLNLINLRSGSDVEISNNNLSYALTSTPSPDTKTSACIFVNAYPDGVASNANIHDNDISFCDVGVLITSKLVNIDYSSAQLSNNNFHDLTQNTSLEKNTGTLKFYDAPIPTPSVAVVPVQENIAKEVPVETSIEEVAREQETNEQVAPPTEEKVEPDPSIPEAPALDTQNTAVEGEQLSASAIGSILSLGTGNTTIGFLVALALIILLGFFVSRKHS